jgi:hypothetical protein
VLATPKGQDTGGGSDADINPSDARGPADVDEPVAPSTRDLLLAKVDGLTGRMTTPLEEVRPVTEQLHPERA